MLWKKESSRPNALYIDILASHSIDVLNQMLNLLQGTDLSPYPVKSDEVAQQKRNEGNAKFRKCEWLDALELYGDCLRFANPGSEHISLAYANRASCFLSLKMYDECLTDIDWAMAAGYPAHLMPKLEQRKAKCLKEKQENPQYERPKLCIESDEKFPYLSKTMANVQRNAKGDFSVVAKTDIDVGEIIGIENAHYTYLWDRFGTTCNICLKEYGNLVPCKKCAIAMFCFECKDHFLHDHECGLYICGEKVLDGSVMNVIRDILLILKGFPCADELMKFVEQIQKNPNGLPDNLLDDRSKFQVLFNYPIRYTYDSIEYLTSVVYPTYKTILRIPHVNKMFNTAKQRRFLMHLIGHQSSIAGQSSHMNHFVSRIKLIMQQYFQRSCCPNVFEIIRDGKAVQYSNMPIKKGEQLFVMHLPVDQVESMQTNKPLVFNALKCQCSKCKGKTLSPDQREQLASDAAYRFVQSNKNVSLGELKSLMNACVTVLRRYGQWNWCDEMQHVIAAFHDLQYYSMAEKRVDINHPLTISLMLKHEGQSP